MDYGRYTDEDRMLGLNLLGTDDSPYTEDDMMPEGEEQDDIGPGPAPEPDEDVSGFIEQALARDEDEDG